MTQSQSVFEKILLEQIARLDLSKYFSDEIQAKYRDAISIASARLSSLHVRAIYGGIKIDSLRDLMESDMTIWDADKNFPLHLAAASGRLFAFPVEKMAVDQLHYINADGCSVFDLAHYYENAQQLPPNLRSARFRQKRIPKPKSEAVIEAARVGKLEKKMRERIMAGLRGEMPISIPAMLPDIFYNAISSDRESSTLLHLAAKNDSFDDIPIEVLTEESLLLRDRRGRTPLHRISSIAGIGGLPPEIVTRKVLTARDHQGISVADVLVDQDTENIVPDNIRLLAKEPVIARIKELIAQSPNAAEDFWSRHGREHLSEQNLHDLVRAQRLQGIIDAIHSGHLIDFKNLDTGDLLYKPPRYPDNPTLVHLIAQCGLLHSLPDGVFTSSILSCQDDSGRTPFHYAAEAGTLGLMPAGLLSRPALLAPDKSGTTSFHIASGKDCFGSVPVSLFDRDVLLSGCSDGRTVADIIEACGNTPLLPFKLRFCSRIAAVRELGRLLATDYHQSEQFWRDHLTPVVGEEEYRAMRREFVRDWSARFADMELDKEQAEAVSEFGLHAQVTARAGSGKTRTLVARALFQITHCRIPASSILILAFNKKAVEEIRERLSKYLSEHQMPHVLTFHALAYRIVRPQEDLIYDEGETEEGQVFSATIQRIIDTELRGGVLEGEFRALMEEQWAADLSRILQQGFHLPQEQFLEFRDRLPRLTIDGRRVKSEADKQVGNFLCRHRVSRYSYQRSLHRYSGESYVPDFYHTNKETERRFVIEILKTDGAVHNPARDAYWKSDRASNSVLIQIPETSCTDGDQTSRYLSEAFGEHEFPLTSMSDDELWDAVKDRAIDNFTKAVKGFISRCQKELITPEKLTVLVDQESGRCEKIQVKFWRLCGEIFTRYLAVLGAEKKTDFDQLMLNAAGKLRDGHTHFTSSRGEGNVSRIGHVLIDEFQDFSHLFNELQKAFIAQSPETLFFCVGDDWQAINKFAGSDLSYFTGFQDTFQPSVRKLITRNYRSCRRIVETGNQVMAGQGEPSIPHSTENGHVLLVGSDGALTYSEAEEIVVEELGEQAVPVLRIVSASASKGYDVAILSRTGTIATPEGMLRLEIWKKRLREFLPESHRKHLKVSTTHGYKGKESETVIVLAPECYPLVHPDAIFSTIFGDTIETLRADEQRLFYVAITRARSRLFILPEILPQARQFPNIPFLPSSAETWFSVNQLSARLVCGGRVVVRLTNRHGYSESSGTLPIKERLKALGYKWNRETKIWSLFLQQGSINSPFECVQFLNAQPWIKDADFIVASFAWEDQKHKFTIDGGRAVPDAGAVSEPEAHVIIGGQWRPIPGSSGQPSSTHGQRSVQTPQTPAQPQPGLVATGMQAVSRIEVHHTRVAGVTYENRAPAIRRLRVGEAVTLMRRPHHPKDPNAIEVLSDNTSSLGYIPATLAAEISRRIDQIGGRLQAIVTEMQPGEADGSYLSLSIRFELPGHSGHSSPQVPVVHSEPPPDTSQPIASVSPPSGSLSPAQINELELLGAPRLRPLITELYRSGDCPWPVLGYEGLDSKGNCTGSLLEVAWPDFKIGIAIPTNDVNSFAASGWTILADDTVTASVLQSLFDGASEKVPSTKVDPTGNSTPPPNIEIPAGAPGITETDHRHQHGPFSDDEPDDDIPF